MKKIASILRLEFLPQSVDLSLLLLRVWLGASMLILHGWGKLIGYQKMAKSFPDPLHVGNQVSLTLAVFGEVVCAVLLMIGLFTRFAALSLTITMAVAFFLAHEAYLKGPKSGEMAFIYMAGFLAILIAGSGRFALDGKKGGARKPRSSE